MIDINFGGLFSIELLHNYYANQLYLCPDFNISISNQTSSVVNGHKMVIKQYNNQLYAGVQSVAAGTGLKPFIAVEHGMQLTFFLWLNNPLFHNFTNLVSGSSLPGKIYYFTNRNNNKANSKNFLSAKILPYNATKTYSPGDLAVDSNTGMVYRAIRSNKPGNQFDLTHANYWTAIDTNQYQSENDALQWMPSLSAYPFTAPQSSAVISVLGYNTATNDYTQSVISQTMAFSSPRSAFPLDLTSLDPGKYSLIVNGKQQWIYINDELNADRPFAVIDIFNDAAPVSCQLVNNNQQLTAPTITYSLSFLNRATIWKYILLSKTAGTIVDTTPSIKYQFTNEVIPDTESIFLSDTPIPLTDTAREMTLTVNSSEYTPIACADPQRLAYFSQNGDTYSCSEIYLNY